MPASVRDGYKRVCDERKYAFVGTEFSKNVDPMLLSCQIVSLPGTSYSDKMSYIISKTTHYKRLINWR
jgi:hypothetical protein